MKHNKTAQPKLLLVAALVSALCIYFVSNVFVELPETPVLRYSSHINKSNCGDTTSVNKRVAAKISRKANASHSLAALPRQHLQVKSRIANTAPEMTDAAEEKKAAPIPIQLTASSDTSSALRNPSYVKKPNATIVTAFYEMPSKHSLHTYRCWIPNMLSLEGPMIVFTTPSFAPFVKSTVTSTTQCTKPRLFS